MSTAPHRDARLPPGTRRILHLDVDAFLASVEQALHPELSGKPVVVGGSPRSRNLVMSCSYEARACGVRAGMRLAEAARRCPRAVFRTGDAQAANRLRDEVTRTLLTFTPQVEVSSIDDFYLDLTGSTRLLGAAFDVAERIRRSVWERARLALTIGIGSNRLVARVVGKLAKPGGIAEVFPGCEAAFLTRLPVEHLPGVGHAIGARLERFALRSVGELRLVPREVLFATFGRAGLVLHERAYGRDETPVEATHAEDERENLVARPPHSIQRETTFEPEEGRPLLIEAMLSYLVERAAHRLRALALVAGALEVHVRWVDTHPRPSAERLVEGLSAARRQALPAPSDSTDELWQLARALYRGFPRRRALVKRLGIALPVLLPGNGWQGRLFGDGPQELHGESRADRQRRLDRVLDELRERAGFGCIVRGTSAPLRETHPLEADGFRLRTPSLNQ